MRDFRTVSASSIADFRRAPRYWRLKYIDDFPVPQTAAQSEGEAIHKEMENYYLHGTEPKTGSCSLIIAAPGVPARDPGILVEYPEDRNLNLVLGGLPVRGRIDLIVPPVDGALQTVDWKSTGNLRYAKTKKELATDVQNTIYTRFGFARWPDATSSTFTHGYILKPGSEDPPKQGYKVVTAAPIDRETNHGLWLSLAETVEEMKQVAAAPKWEDVPKCSEDPDDFKSPCRAYGGCPFREKCWGGASTSTSFFGGFVKQEVVVEETPQPTVDATPPPAPAVTTSTGRLTLYVDCMIEDEVVPRLEPVLESIAQQVLTEYNRVKGQSFSDLGLIGFGGGMAGFKALLKEKPLTGGPYALADRGLGNTALEIFRAQGAKIIRACR